MLYSLHPSPKLPPCLSKSVVELDEDFHLHTRCKPCLGWNLTSGHWLQFFMYREFSCFIFQGNVLSTWSLTSSKSLVIIVRIFYKNIVPNVVLCMVGGEEGVGGQWVSSLVPRKQVSYFWITPSFQHFLLPFLPSFVLTIGLYGIWWLEQNRYVLNCWGRSISCSLPLEK